MLKKPALADDVLIATLEGEFCLVPHRPARGKFTAYGERRAKSFLRTGILVGLLFSVLAGFVYLQILGAPSSQFYIFAALAFFVGPMIAGIVDALRSPPHQVGIFLMSSGITFLCVFILFILTYAVLIRFFTTTVALPAYCDGTYAQSNIPPKLEYPLSNNEKGILINADERVAVAAKIDYDQADHAITLFIINKATGEMLADFYIPQDNIAVAMDSSTVYPISDGLGLLVDKFTGEREDTFLTMDAYGRNDLDYFETSGIISSWHRNGSVKSLPYLSFNGIVRGCYISADTKAVIKL